MSKPPLNNLTSIQKTVLEFWEQGLTGGMIASRTGMTRGAVMGIVNRLRLKGFVDYRVPVKSRSNMAKQKNKTRQRRLPLAMPVEKKKYVEEKGPSVSDMILEAIVVPKSQRHGVGLPFQMLKRRSCKYSVNNSNHSSGHLFCGEPTKDLSPYCDEHHALCYVTVAKYKKSNPKTNIVRSKYDHRT